MEKEKYIESFGSLPFVEDVRDYRLKKSIVKSEVFPEEFTLVPPKVKNQGAVGSCVAHAIAETVEYHNREQEKTNTLMSTGFIYGNRRNSLNKSSGMFIREALSNTCKYGTTTQKEFFENAEVPKAINLFEEADLFEEEINSYSESLGYPSYEDYYIEALEESINNMVGLYYDEIVMEAEDGSDTKKEDTKSDKKQEDDNGVETKEKGKNKISFRNKSQMLIRKIQILLQKFVSVINRIIGQVNDLATKAISGTMLTFGTSNIIKTRIFAYLDYYYFYISFSLYMRI